MNYSKILNKIKAKLTEIGKANFNASVSKGDTQVSMRVDDKHGNPIISLIVNREEADIIVDDLVSFMENFDWGYGVNFKSSGDLKRYKKTLEEERKLSW